MAGSEGTQTQEAERSGEQRNARVISPNQMVILRESDLDCDLATAIQRIRGSEDTSRSRILIVGPDDEVKDGPAYSEPLPMPSLPMSIGQVARAGGQQALTDSGERVAPKMESLGTLLGELDTALNDLEEAVQEGIQARLGGRLKVAREISDWIRATAEDVTLDVEGMSGGFQSVDLFELVHEIHGQVETFFPELCINLTPAEGDSHCWARATDLSEALFIAMAITSHRISGRGSINIEVVGSPEEARVRMLGLGEPVPVAAGEEMGRFRQILVEEHGGRIVPDALGPGGTGLIIALPRKP